VVRSARASGNACGCTYSKIGASTRATASLFAVQHGLLPEEDFPAGVAA
jgi:hypothetical protein